MFNNLRLFDMLLSAVSNSTAIAYKKAEYSASTKRRGIVIMLVILCDTESIKYVLKSMIQSCPEGFFPIIWFSISIEKFSMKRCSLFSAFLSLSSPWFVTVKINLERAIFYVKVENFCDPFHAKFKFISNCEWH